MKVVEYKYKHQGAANWLVVVAWFLLAKRLHCSDWIFYLVLVLLALVMNYGLTVGRITDKASARR
jgi:hypothetical protein